MDALTEEARAALAADPTNELLQQLVLSCEYVLSSGELLDSAATKAREQPAMEPIAVIAKLAVSMAEGFLPGISARWRTSRSPESCLRLVSAQLMLASSRETLALIGTAVGPGIDIAKPKALLDSAVKIAMASLVRDYTDTAAITSMLQVHGILQRMIKTSAAQVSEPTIKMPGLPFQEFKHFMHAARAATFRDRAGNLAPFDMGNEQVVGGVLELPTGTYFLGLGAMGSKVYVIEDCWRVWKLMQAHRRVLHVATPGCGKSIGAMALICQLIRQKRTVVYRSKELSMGNRCFVFQENVAARMPFEDARDLLEVPDTWFISDGIDGGGYRCHFLMVTSPDTTKVTEFRKQQAFVVFIGRLWTEEELLAAGKVCHPRIPEDLILHRSRLLGPVPRLVFCADESTFACHLQFVVAAVETTTSKHIFACLLSNTWEKFSHRILLLNRAPDGSACQRIASKFVAGLVLARMLKYKMDKVRAKITELRGMKEHAVDVGRMLEAMFHAVFPPKLESYTHICAGLCSRAKHADLETTAQTCIRDTYGDYEHFVSKFLQYVKDKKGPAVYFMPLSDEEAAIDSLYVDFARKIVHLYQLTINQEHGVIKSVIQRWLAFFESYGFTVTGLVFVTDNVSFPGMKTQAWKIKEETLEDDKLRHQFSRLFDAANQKSPVCQYKVLFNYDFNSEKIDLHGDFQEYIQKVNKFQQALTKLEPSLDSRKRMRSLYDMDDKDIEQTLAAVGNTCE